ncbi:MAG: hypothetical protein JSR15_06705 [Proteobacteria bacterium]|nr:hypothetical protein [Pseudomonadota bacterium]
MFPFSRWHALRALTLVAVWLAAVPVRASEGGDVAELRAQLDALKSDYQAKIHALETRVAQLEAQVASQPPPQAQPPVVEQPPLPPPTPSGGGGGANAFNPAVSVILGGRYAQLDADPSTYHIAGFMPSGDEVGPGRRGFDLGESELTLSANVDPWFYANLTASITGDNSINVEEAFVKTLALPSGLSLKAGRFFSGVGYVNEVHSHAWDFADQPLVYQAMFGGQLTQDGAQLKWLAPTDLFIELGAETGDGGQYPGTRLAGNGLNGGALLAHIGNDIGDSASWRAGISWLTRRAENRSFDDVDASGAPLTDAFTGRSRTWIADAILKWAPHGNAYLHSFKLQGEYLQRTEDGQLAVANAQQQLAGLYHARQSGWYVQGVYQFLPRWRFGARYDSLDSGDIAIGLVQQGLLPLADFGLLAPASPSRVSAMFDWNPSEFTRLRLQYAWDSARLTQRDRQLMLQYLYAIGAHGAHKF